METKVVKKNSIKLYWIFTQLIFFVASLLFILVAVGNEDKILQLWVSLIIWIVILHPRFLNHITSEDELYKKFH